jgi:hypothetical protein
MVVVVVVVSKEILLKSRLKKIGNDICMYEATSTTSVRMHVAVGAT